MRCCECKRYIAAGVEAQKMIVEYQQDDGSVRFFGHGMSDGVITDATGRILRARHHKCYHVARKREARGNAVTGRVLTGMPTAYQAGQHLLSDAERAALGVDPGDESAMNAQQLHQRLQKLHAVAEQIGKAVGDLTVMEAFWAQENGGPYEHLHRFRLEPYQLMAHLYWAHGVGFNAHHNWAAEHERLHVQAQQQVIERVRAGEKESPVRDWREQFTAEINRKEPDGSR